mgnify:FL=1
MQTHWRWAGERLPVPDTTRQPDSETWIYITLVMLSFFMFVGASNTLNRLNENLEHLQLFRRRIFQFRHYLEA